MYWWNYWFNTSSSFCDWTEFHMVATLVIDRIIQGWINTRYYVLWIWINQVWNQIWCYVQVLFSQLFFCARRPRQHRQGWMKHIFSWSHPDSTILLFKLKFIFLHPILHAPICSGCSRCWSCSSVWSTRDPPENNAGWTKEFLLNGQYWWNLLLHSISISF